MDKPITVGQLNSDLGKDYASMLRASSLSEIIDWCLTASTYLKDSKDYAEQADAAVFYVAACILRQLKEFAA